MPDSLRLPARMRPRALTAASAQITPDTWRSGQFFGNRPWQEEAWGFRDTLGEFSQAVDWEARAMSRIRLGAAEVIPGGDEPEMLEDGPASQLMQDFCGGPPGHSAFLAAITPQLVVPGEGWLIAERDDPALPLSLVEWGVYSTDCVTALGGNFRVRIGESIWRDLAPDNLPIRIYNPHPRFPWLATSAAQAAVPIMRRIHLIDSRIIAMMVSRLAMNGLLLIPQEGTFSVPEQYGEGPDNFVRFLIDIASKNIANPGQASAGIPIPVRYTAEFIDKWKILKADDPLDEWLLKERIDELGRLGDALKITRERVTGGMGEQNHWGQWQASEEEVKLTFSPTAENICGAVTKGYLQPALIRAGQSPLGPNGGKIIAWYDVTELTARPDKSDAVVKAYDRLEASGTALRRELGLDESDAPTPDELGVMVWKKVAGSDTLAPTAEQQLDPGGAPVAPVPGAAPSAGPAASGPAPAEPAAPVTGPPTTQAAPPPPPGPMAASVFIADKPRRYNGVHAKR
jgi:hypothetical protein